VMVVGLWFLGRHQLLSFPWFLVKHQLLSFPWFLVKHLFVLYRFQYYVIDSFMPMH